MLKNLETFDWLVIMVLAALLLSKLISRLRKRQPGDNNEPAERNERDN